MKRANNIAASGLLSGWEKGILSGRTQGLTLGLTSGRTLGRTLGRIWGLTWGLTWGLILCLALCLTGCQKEEVKLHHVYLSSTTDKMAPGDSAQFSLLAYPAESTTGFPNAAIVWSTSDSTVLSISQSGMAHALRFGQATVRADYGPFKAEKKIIVSTLADIKDATLLKFLVERYDTDGDGRLEGFETQAILGLDLTELRKLTAGRVDMTGLDHFINLQTLRIEQVRLKNLDLRPFSALREIHFERVELDTLDLRQNAAITDVRLIACDTLQALLLGSYADYGTNNLRTLQCARCNIAELDLSRCGATLWDIDVTQNPRLTHLDLSCDSSLHSLYYSCGTTNVVWPVNVDPDEVIHPRCDE